VNELPASLMPDGEHDARLLAMYRNSARAFATKFYDEHFTPPLRVEFGDPANVDALAFGAITTALQLATAKIAKGLVFPGADSFRRTQQDVDRAPLVPLGSFGNALLFSFPTPTLIEPGQAEWDIDAGYTLTEAAVKELVTVLPKTLDDRASIDVLPAQAKAVRSAMKTLADAIRTTGGIKVILDLAKLDGHVESVLSSDQAKSVEIALSGKRDRLTEETVQATLDGVRTQRRIFYLVKSDGAELHGPVGPELLPRIREYLGRKVTARLQKIVVEDDAGHQSRPVFRLLRLDLDTELDI